MKRLVPLFLVAAAALCLTPSESQAFGRRHRGDCCEAAPCASGCQAACAPAVCAPVPPPAPPKMIAQKVTRYKEKWSEKEVTVNVCKLVSKEEKYKYVVCVPVTKQEKRMVTTYNCVTKEVEYKYTVMVPHTYPEKRLVKYCEYETKMVKEMVPVCKRVAVTCVDACGCPHTTCQTVTENVEVTRCVRTPIYKTKEVVCNVVKCEPEVRVGKKCIVESHPVTKEVIVNVCSIERQEKVGTRTVCHQVMEPVKHKVKVCEMVPYTDTIMVPECTTAACAPACDTCDSGHKRHRLFGHRDHGCETCCN